MIRKTATFVVAGEFLTDRSRAIWAEGSEPERAVRLLVRCVHDLSLDDAVAILTGRRKLVGDSSNGLELVEDESCASAHGLPLPSFDDAFRGVRERAERAERDAQDLIDLDAGRSYIVYGPKGVRQMAVSTALDVKAGRISWDDVRIYRERERMSLDAYDEARLIVLPAPGPTSFSLVTTDTGWLSPSGRFYPCGYAEHLSLADRIEEHVLAPSDNPMIGAGRRLEELGWVKLAGRQGVFEGQRRPTKAQCRLLLDWCTGEGEGKTPLPYFLEPE